MHPRDRLLQALVDRELNAEREAEVLRHTASCARCSARLERVRSLTGSFSGAILDIDAAEPVHWHNAGLETPALDRLTAEAGPRLRVERGGASAPAAPPAPRERRRAGRTGAYPPLRWAALFVLGTAAIGAAALLVDRLVNDEPAPAVTVTGQTPDGVTRDIAGAVVVLPVAGAITVRVMDAGEDTRLIVELVDASNVAVQVEGQATPRFEARDGHVEVSLAGASANVRVRVPRSIGSAEVSAQDRVLARVRDGQIAPPEAASGLRLR
ncbi:MAG: zf-HC2 domain-containing protein [Gemmatimonadetes bacterium]|nr:zf-HC2 domain-containing protein [Gemmatimonadota bacterium]